MCAAGSVVVLDNGGRENATVWGDILTWVAHRRGVAGTVIDGACRDTHLSRELGYPIYSRSYSMRTGKDRVQVEAMNGPVNIGDARVEPGDLLRGDADGVLVIPRAHEDAVLAAAEEIDAVEQQIRAAINDGQTLAEARRQLGTTSCRAARSPAELRCKLLSADLMYVVSGFSRTVSESAVWLCGAASGQQLGEERIDHPADPGRPTEPNRSASSSARRRRRRHALS